jgi:hypothetical protein
MLRVLLAALLGLVMTGSLCEEVVPEREWERGFFRPIGGKPYQFPEDLTIVTFVGYEDEIATSFLPLRLHVRNTSSQRVTDVMPEGLAFRPRVFEYQFMMLLQQFTITVPPDADTVILLPTYCCNEDLDEPDEDGAYQFDIQVWERELNELFDLVRDKDLSGDLAVDIAQEALFEITDGEGLTELTRAQLDSLP